MHAAAALIAALRSAGVSHLFGNPGTTELPFLDALDGSALHYVVGLQEATVVAAADGYAQATGEVGVANVHVTPGLANALSILHNAARSRSPVLLTAGQQDTRLLVHEPILAGDLVKMAEPFTKWAYEIRSADEAVTVLGRAVTIALTPPTGPVFLSLPMDLMTDDTDAPAPRTQGPSAQRPGVPVIQLAADPQRSGRSYPVDLAFAAAITPMLRLIADELAERLSGAQRAAAADRRAQLERVRVDFVARTRAAAEAEAERAPISPAHLMHTLAGLLPDDVVIVDESASSLPHVLRHLPFRRPGSFYGSKTGTLGWAMGAAIGVQLADPRRKVVVTIGDGSVMYAPQALWTAAHEGLPITYVVANNTSYAILKAGMATLGLAGAKTGFYPGMDLTAPEVDYVRLAESLGVRAVRVEKPGELSDALADGLAHRGPSLVDVSIDRTVRGGV